MSSNIYKRSFLSVEAKLRKIYAQPLHFQAYFNNTSVRVTLQTE
jgi:hypothetical protein